METFEPFRSPTHLLTATGIQLLKTLTRSEHLQVHCINVEPQRENECGAISLGLAVQLCFYPEGEGAIRYRLLNVRDDLLHCLKQNALGYFRFSKVKTGNSKKILFSINC